MMLGKQLELELTDGTTYTVAYNGIDLRAYEAAFNASVLSEPMSLTMLTWLAWAAGKRTGVLNGEWQAWATFEQQCTGVRVVADVPTPTKARKGSKAKQTAATQTQATAG